MGGLFTNFDQSTCIWGLLLAPPPGLPVEDVVAATAADEAVAAALAD